MRLFLPALLGLAAATAAFADRRLDVDLDNSRLEVDVKATVDSFTGHLERFQPSLQIDDRGHVSAARVAFAFADLKTGKPKRDQAMHEWQHTDQFPDGEFELGSLGPAGENRYLARGTLRLHGVKKEISFPLSIIADHGVYALDGEVALDTRDFDLPVIRVMAFLKVDPAVKVRFHLQAHPANP